MRALTRNIYVTPFSGECSECLQSSHLDLHESFGGFCDLQFSVLNYVAVQGFLVWGFLS